MLLLSSSGCSLRALPGARPGFSEPATQSKSRPERAVATLVPPPEPTLDDSGDSDREGSALDADDEPDSPELAAPELGAPLPHPLDGWSEERVERAVTENLASLGSMSVGTPNAGALVNGVQASASALYTLVSPGSSWGTTETIESLNTAVRAVQSEFPDTPPLALGDIGAKRGGPLRPHISHQAGRDLDISFYYRDGTHWYARGTSDNLDFPRLWAFVRALIASTDIDLILLDRGLQKPLEDYARSLGEDASWLEQVFHGKGGQRAIILHAPGHATHLHLRFYNPIAQETARRCYSALVHHALVKTPERYLTHKTKKNETLGMIAKKYGSTVSAIREANGLRSNRIREQAVYRIPVLGGGGVRIPKSERVRIPARRLPPPRHEPAHARAASSAAPALASQRLLPSSLPSSSE